MWEHKILNEMRELLHQIKTDSLKRASSDTDSVRAGNYVSPDETSGSNIYIDKKIFNPGERIPAGENLIPVERETVMVFSDDDPLHNWSHACRYFLYDAKNGELYKNIDADLPPYMAYIPATYSSFHHPVNFPEEQPLNYQDVPVDIITPDNDSGRNKFAILYSGTSEYRHVNDIEYLYRTLIQYHHFLPDNIYVLNYDGSTKYTSFYPPTDIWPGNATPYRMKVNADGSRSELVNVFDEIGKRLKPEDLLFIHTNNHGLGSSEKNPSIESALSTYAKMVVRFTASEFGDKLACLPKISQLVIMMEQCHSGGFKDAILNNSTADKTCFIAACEADQRSYGGKYHNVFAKHWIQVSSKLIGMINPFSEGGTSEERSAFDDPSPEPDYNVHENSLRSAFEAAKLWSIKDTPVMYDKPKGCSKNIELRD